MSLYQRPGSAIWSYEFEFKGKRFRGSCETVNKTEAKAIEVRKRAEAKADADAHRAGMRRMTLGALADAWLAESTNSHRDHRNNESRVRKLFGETLKRNETGYELAVGARAGLKRDMMVHELTQSMLTALKKLRVAEGSSPATWNREVALIQSLLGYAPSLSCVMPNPAITWTAGRNKAANLKAKEPKGKLRWLTIDQEVKLLALLWAEHRARPGEVAPLDSHDLSMLLLSTGARYMEAAHLQWSSVDLEAGTVSIYRPKVDNESALKLPAHTLEMLKRRHALLAPTRRYVFPAITGKSWHHEDYPRAHSTVGIQAAIDALGINADKSKTRVTPHTFRDTFASRMVQAGLTLYQVQKLLGHSNPAMTQKYAHLSMESTGAEAAAVLDKVYAPKGLRLVETPHESPHDPISHSQQLPLRAVG